MAKTEIVTSPANPLVKQVRRAIRRGALTADGCCVAEGFHLLGEARRSGCEIRTVLAAASVLQQVPPGMRTVALSDALFKDLSGTEAPQGVLALVRPPAFEPAGLFADPPLVVVLDGVQDPGNAGAILRAAEAFGASGAMFLKGAVSPYNPKSVRASAGSLFRLPLVTGLEPAAARAALAGRRLAVYAAMPSDGLRPDRADLRRPCALIVGSEGHGVGEALRAGATHLRIPVRGVESLNAALAAGILLYEAARQRSFSSASSAPLR